MLSRFVIPSLAALCLAPVIGVSNANAQEADAPETQPAPEVAPATEAAPAPEVAPAAEAAPVATEATPAATAEAAVAAEVTAKKDVEEIVVTGSRIRRIDLTTSAPVTVLTKEQLQATGKMSIGEILQYLPEQANGINIQYNNGGDGSTRVDLRGLGASRTLVLLNGRRFVAGGTGADSSVDLNSIPTAVIERVEVLKDGASSVYGSDAIGGVVNIITKKNWSGTEFGAYYGGSQRGDGSLLDLSVTTGQTTDKGSVLFSAGYSRQNPVWAGDRDFSKFDWDYDYRSRQVFTSGSSRVPGTLIIDLETDENGMPISGYEGNADWQELAQYNDPDGPGAGYYTRDLNTKEWRPFNFNGAYGEGGDLYNYQPENYLVTPQKRYYVFSLGDVKLGTNARGYYELSYTNRRSKQTLAPEPFDTLSEGLVVSANNYYNPFGRDFAGVRKRMVDFGNRSYAQDIDTFRVVMGLDGTVPESMGPLAGWFWDLSLNYGRTQGTTVKTGNLRKNRVAQAIGPSYMGSDGVVYCGTSDADRIEGCVPLDLFGPAGSITPAMKDYLTFSGVQRGFTQQTMFQANTTGDLFAIKSDDPVRLALGIEMREEKGMDLPDPVTAGGDTTGNKQAATGGKYDVKEGYAELMIPVVGDIAGIDYLELNLAMRGFDYSSFGSGMTYQAGVRWRIIPDLTLRGTYSTAFRAPSIGQLYLGNTDSFEQMNDLCADRVQGSEIDARCDAQGIPDDLTQNDSQIHAVWQGNTKLDPEKAVIITGGLVYTPSFLQDLSVTLDGYSIKVEDSITRVGAETIMNLCYGENSGDRGGYCDKIIRDGFGNITMINDPMTNVGSDETQGIDFAVRYALPTSAGRFGFNLDTNYTIKFDQTQANGDVIEGVGVYDLGVFPHWKSTGSILWGMEELAAGTTIRYIGNFKECENNSCKDQEVGGKKIPALSRDVGSYTAVDLFVSYALESPLGTTDMMVGMSNVFDARPNAVYASLTADSEPSTYDFMGRYGYIKLTQSF